MGNTTRRLGAVTPLGFLMMFFQSWLFLSCLPFRRSSILVHWRAFSLLLGASPTESGRIMLFPPSNLVVDLHPPRRLLLGICSHPRTFRRSGLSSGHRCFLWPNCCLSHVHQGLLFPFPMAPYHLLSTLGCGLTLGIPSRLSHVHHVQQGALNFVACTHPFLF